MSAKPINTWKISELNDYVGGLSNPSKMPGYGYSIPAKECKVGTKLREVVGSTCSGCYAMKGRYVFPMVQNALYRRLDAIRKPEFVEVMSELINRRADKSPWFRWHDSGDLQDTDHLAAIIQIAKNTPTVSHWLPTREYRIVLDYIKANGRDSIPSNLTIRMSAHMIGGAKPKVGGLPISTVSNASTDYPTAHLCPAPSQGNNCGDCRACWDSSVPHVDYHRH